MNYKEICASVAVYKSVHPSKPRPVSINKQFIRDLIASAKLNEWVYYMREDTYKLLTQGNEEVWVNRNEIYVQTCSGSDIWRVADLQSVPALMKAPFDLYIKLQQTLHRQVRSIHPTTGPFPPDMLKKLETRDAETGEIEAPADWMLAFGDWISKRIPKGTGDSLDAISIARELAKRVEQSEDVTESEGQQVLQMALELACRNCKTFDLISDPKWYMDKARSIINGELSVEYTSVDWTESVCSASSDTPPQNDMSHCLDFDNIIHGYVDLAGKVLTILDAAYNNAAQNKAVKRLVKNEFNDRMAMIRDFLFPKSQDAPQRELPTLEAY